MTTMGMYIEEDMTSAVYVTIAAISYKAKSRRCWRARWPSTFFHPMLAPHCMFSCLSRSPAFYLLKACFVADGCSLISLRTMRR